MSMPMRAAPPELIPPRLQGLWRTPAVMNFALGGLGAGLYLATVAAGAVGRPGALGFAAWLGPALVLAGFAAVATEAGRPLRGLRVMTRVGTSWMSREVWIGGAFAVFALSDLIAPSTTWRVLAAAAALALAFAQGCIVRCARGVAAWDVSPVPALFLSSALLSGGGLLGVLAVARGSRIDRYDLGVLATLSVLGALVWFVYVTGSDDREFLAATAALRAGPLAAALAGSGYLGPFVLSVLGMALPALAPAAALGAGALMIAGQVGMKWALLLRVGRLRPITLALPRRPR